MNFQQFLEVLSYDLRLRFDFCFFECRSADDDLQLAVAWEPVPAGEVTRSRFP